ncbi:unnamed protein product [Amaranthus hypochondriacus]
MEKNLTKILQNFIFKSKIALQISLSLILFTIITLQSSKNLSFKRLYTSLHISDHTNGAPYYSSPTKCDIFSGEWVHDSDAPYYTGETCGYIEEHQNCMKHGRPDTEFMKWRWKPNGCELPVFDPHHFLEIVKDKSMAFVGDSVARNHMQSLLCLLSRVEQPLNISTPSDLYIKRWYYQSYNFTLAMFWSPFLVKTQEDDPNDTSGKKLIGLFLDEPNGLWADQIDGFDFVIMSAGHWFLRPLIYYESGQLVGCRLCENKNVTNYSYSLAYQNAFHTAFRTILARETFRGRVFLRTFSPDHFEGGQWDNGADCIRQKPMKINDTDVKSYILEMNMVQSEVFKEAQTLAQKRGLNFGLLDITRVMLMRPDGHPSKYGRPPHLPHWNDCVHWCLPGAIDTWNQFLLEMLTK